MNFFFFGRRIVSNRPGPIHYEGDATPPCHSVWHTSENYTNDCIRMVGEGATVAQGGTKCRAQCRFGEQKSVKILFTCTLHGIFVYVGTLKGYWNGLALFGRSQIGSFVSKDGTSLHHLSNACPMSGLFTFFPDFQKNGIFIFITRTSRAPTTFG